MAQLGTKARSAVASLTKLLQSENKQLRVLAAFALFRIAPETKGLESVLREALGSRDHEVRGMAAMTLAQMNLDTGGGATLVVPGGPDLGPFTVLRVDPNLEAKSMNWTKVMCCAAMPLVGFALAGCGRNERPVPTASPAAPTASPAAEAAKTPTSSSRMAQVLTSWQNGDKVAAVSQFVQVDWKR